MQWLGLPEFERSEASFILGFSQFLGYTYLQAPFPGKEEVSQGPAVCAACCVSSHGMKRRTLPQMLAIGNRWQKEVLSYNGSVCWAEMLPSCDLSLQSAEYTRGVFLSHSFTLLAAQAGGLRGNLQNGVTFAYLLITILHSIFIVMIITLSFW